MRTSKELYANSIAAEGYAATPVPFEGEDVSPLFRQFQEVTAAVFDESSPRAADLYMALKNTVPHRALDSPGFIEQRRVGKYNPHEIGRPPGTDNKDVLHYTPRTETVAHEYMRTRGGLPKCIADLLASCRDVYQDVCAATKPVFEVLGVDEVLFGKEDENIHILRILHYLGNTPLSMITRRSPLAMATLLSFITIDPNSLFPFGKVHRASSDSLAIIRSVIHR